MMKYLKSSLFAAFLGAVYMAYAFYSKIRFGSTDGFTSRIIYAGVFICFLICAGFGKTPAAYGALLLTGAAFTAADGTFAYTFLPVYVNLFFIMLLFEEITPETNIICGTVFNGTLITSLVYAGFSFWLFSGMRVFTVGRQKAIIYLIIISSVCLVLTALSAMLVSRLVKKGKINPSGASALMCFLFPYLEITREEVSYKKKKKKKNTKALPVNVSHLLSAALFAFGVIKYMQIGFFGAETKLFFFCWALMVACTICFKLGFDFPGKFREFISSGTEESESSETAE